MSSLAQTVSRSVARIGAKQVLIAITTFNANKNIELELGKNEPNKEFRFLPCFRNSLQEQRTGLGYCHSKRQNRTNQNKNKKLDNERTKKASQCSFNL